MRYDVDPNNPHGHGGVTEQEGRILAGIAAACGGPVLEIGGAAGRSTKFILDGLAASNGTVVSVDPDHHAGWDHPRLVRLHCLSDDPQVVEEVGPVYTPQQFRQVSWVFIDGSHEAPWPLHDLKLAKELGARFAVCHDATWPGWPDVAAALEEFGRPYTIIPTECGLAVVELS